MTFAEDFWGMLTLSSAVVITSHVSQDDDAIASVLATYWIVKQKLPDKRVEMVLTGVPDQDRYRSFLNYNEIKFVDDFFNSVNEYDMAIFADASQWGRFGSAVGEMTHFKGKTVCIDHHGGNSDSFDLKFIDSEAGSCTELVYDLLVSGKVEEIQFARIILLGILGDTNGFKYLRPDQLRAFDIGREMLELVGKSIQDFTAEYATISERNFRLISKLILSTEFHSGRNKWPDWQSAGLDRNDVEKGGYSEIEVSEAQHLYMDNYLRWISGYKWGVVFTPKSGGKYNLSLRTLTGGVNVRKIMEKMNVGGGHDLAAGGTYKSEGAEEIGLSEVKERFQKWLEENSSEELT